MTQIEHENDHVNDHVNDVDPMTDAQVAHRDRIMEWLRLTDEQQIAALAHVRPDTREQAAASPSAVGEGQARECFILVPEQLEGRAIGLDKLGAKVAASAYRSIAGEIRAMLRETLSSQAPKPASAGGELPLDELVELVQRACLHVPRGIEASDAASRCYSDLDSMAKRLRALRRKTIAAEADTTKPKEKEGGVWMWVADRFVNRVHALVVSAPPDRLAPSEARGAEKEDEAAHCAGHGTAKK